MTKGLVGLFSCFPPAQPCPDFPLNGNDIRIAAKMLHSTSQDASRLKMKDAGNISCLFQKQELFFHRTWHRGGKCGELLRSPKTSPECGFIALRQVLVFSSPFKVACTLKQELFYWPIIPGDQAIEIFI